MTAAHQTVELALGTGIIGQAQLGFPGAIAASVALDGGWVAAACRRRPPERVLAYLAGVAIGVPFIHFTLWPWSVRSGLPMLDEAEGLPQETMGLYNGILYLWAAAGVLALWKDTLARHRPWAILGFLSIVGFRRTAKQHFGWIEREGKRNPQWWNRAWAEAATEPGTAAQPDLAGATSTAG